MLNVMAATEIKRYKQEHWLETWRASLPTSPAFAPRNRNTKKRTEHPRERLLYFVILRGLHAHRRALTHGSKIKSRELYRLNQPGALHLALLKVLNKRASWLWPFKCDTLAPVRERLRKNNPVSARLNFQDISRSALGQSGITLVSGVPSNSQTVRAYPQNRGRCTIRIAASLRCPPGPGAARALYYAAHGSGAPPEGLPPLDSLGVDTGQQLPPSLLLARPCASGELGQGQSAKPGPRERAAAAPRPLPLPAPVSSPCSRGP